jgi:murein DD-endopeptidase MepM/ murein hydrolase activator NlpD
VSTGEPPPPAGLVAAAQAESLPSDGVYRVRAGEHLLAIARRFGVPMQQIAALNRLKAPYALRIGQELQLPVAMAGAPTPSAKPVAHIAAPALSGDGFLWPVQGKIVGRFGQSNEGLRRDGVNIAARKGTPVRAAEDGVVVYANEGIRGYGRMILLRHSDDYVTTYAHNAALLVSVGDIVRRGQIIARVGDTGSVAGAQLHFEIRKGLTPLDPEDLLVHETTEIASSH